MAICQISSSPHLFNEWVQCRNASMLWKPRLRGSDLRVLRSQLLICGYGAAGKAVAKAFESRGLHRNAITFVERSPERANCAQKRGFLSVSGDATNLARLRIAGTATAHKIIVCVGDDKAAAVVAAIKKAGAHASVSAVIEHPNAKPDVLSAGCAAVIVLSEMAGQLLAESAFLPRMDTKRD